MRAAALAAWLTLAAGGPAGAQAPAVPFDVEAATTAYLASVPADARAASDAYFEGGYWLQLWGFLATVGVNLLVLTLGWSRRMRDAAARITRFRTLQPFLYWTEYLLVTTVLLFPLTAYAGFVREHQYGLATQTFGSWLGDQGMALLVGVLFAGALMVALYAALRRAPRTWWLWGSGVVVGFAAVGLTIGPAYIAPLFNTYTPLEDARVRDPILSMARANGIMAHVVYQVDASRQSTRISANVSGFLGTDRITLNDNLLARGTLAEVKAVMGHEMGHYVLHHVYTGLASVAVFVLVGFAFVRWGFGRAVRRWGAAWGVDGIADPAGLPLVVLILAIYGFALTPALNTVSRTTEYEADIFGLNAAGEPDGFATIALKLAEYRKLSPGPVEEFLFFDHPSGRTRVRAAMRWKAEHLDAPPLPRSP